MDGRPLKLGNRKTRLTTLEPDYSVTGGGQLLGHDTAHHADADHDDVDGFQSLHDGRTS